MASSGNESDCVSSRRSASPVMSASVSQAEDKLEATKNRSSKEKQTARQGDESKGKVKSKKSLIPFYSTFGFGNKGAKGAKSPDKEKRRKTKCDSNKSLYSDDNDDEGDKNDNRKSSKSINSAHNCAAGTENISPSTDLYYVNRLYDEMCRENDSDSGEQYSFKVKKELKSPKLSSKLQGDKKYSLVKSRIAKYQKHSQKDRCSSPEEFNLSDPGISLSRQRAATVANCSKFDAVRSKFQTQVSNMSYEGMEFNYGENNDIDLDKQELYDELKLIYDGEDLYAFREHSNDACALLSDSSRPHLSIDSITLISNDNMKASLNISLSGSGDRINAGLPDPRWKESGRFSRRSLKKRSYRNIKESKSIKSSSNSSSNRCSPPRENENSRSKSMTSLSDRLNEKSPICEKFPEYATVNKKKHLTSLPIEFDAVSSDIRKPHCKGGADKGPVAKKVEQLANRQRKEQENGVTPGCSVKRTESTKGSKVIRKGSFSCNSRPRVSLRPNLGSTQIQNDSTNSFVKTQAVKLKRRDSQTSRKNGYKLSVTIQPSTVASLTDKFNSMILQNQASCEHSGKIRTEIPLGQVSFEDGKLCRVYHSPRASFRRKYRTKAHKNKRCKADNDHLKGAVANFNVPDEDESSHVSTIQASSTKCFDERFSATAPVRPVTIQKIPSIIRNSSDNKTDEEKVYDKIETALLYGKFKGETDESDADQDETEDDTVSDQIVEDHLQPLLSQSTWHNDTISSEDIGNFENIASRSSDSTVFDPDGNVLINKSASTVAKLCSSEGEFPTCANHQKSGSIDSGILSDEVASSSPVTNRIPETVEEDYSNGITGAIDHCSIDTNNSVATCKSEDSGLDVKSSSKMCSLDNTDSDQEAEHPENDPNEENVVSCDERPYLNETEASTQAEVYNSVDHLKDSEQTNSKLLLNDESTSDSDNKIYSTLLKAVVKNTVRRTKEKDFLKRETEKDNLIHEKESWFRRSKSKERSKNSIIEGAKENTDDTDTVTNSAIDNNSFNCSQSSKTLLVASDKDEKDIVLNKKKENKIYESWIFRKIRERSQERRKFKDVTQVEVQNDNDSLSTKSKSENLSIVLQTVSHNAEIQNSTEALHGEKSSDTQEKNDNYGLFSFKSRGRSKDKKRTATSARKNDEEEFKVDESSVTETAETTETSKQIVDSPKLSVSTIVNSENASSLKASSKLKASSSQRSTTSIPPPPKTPIPSPPKSARIILNLQEDSDKDDTSKDGLKVSSENIYEKLYSTDIDEVKKSCINLQESGITPNSSFLWSYACPPTTGNTSESDGEVTTKPSGKPPPFSRITGIKSYARPEKNRRDSSLPRICHLPDSTQNYSELNALSSDESHTTVAYDEIGGLSTVSYDDIRMSTSCSYDDIRAPSSVGYDSLKPPSSGGGYDPVNPPSARSDSSQYDECDGVVKAQLVVVREDQLDSISYLYDDITYNASQTSHSYEPVNPPGVGGPYLSLLLTEGHALSQPYSITSIQEVPEGENSPGVVEQGEDDEESSLSHEVFSYTLTPLPSVKATSEISSDTISDVLTSTFDANNSVSTEAVEKDNNSSDAGTVESLNVQNEVSSLKSTVENDPAALSIGLRDSLRSSTSSYHSAYSSKYFMRSRMLDSLRSKEEERPPLSVALPDQRSGKKQSKLSDDYKESTFSFVGRKFRELGKFGRNKNNEKDSKKKLENDDLTTVKRVLHNSFSKASKSGGSNEGIETPTKHQTLSDSIKLDNGVECESAKLKKKKPNLSLSDCPPLEDDCSELNSELYVTPKEDDGESHENDGNKSEKSPLQKVYGTSATAATKDVFKSNAIDSLHMKNMSEPSAHNENARNFDKHSKMKINHISLEVEGQDEWEDIGDVSDSELSDRELRQFVRVPLRSRRCVTQPKIWRKTWSQSFRDVAITYPKSSFLQSRESLKDVKNNGLPSHCTDKSYMKICEHFLTQRQCSSPLPLKTDLNSVQLGALRKAVDASPASESGRIERCEQFVLGKLKSRKNKYILHSDKQPVTEGRYRKRRRKYFAF